MLSAYMAEACGGCDFHLNVCLFYVGESQTDTMPPACYASRTDTAAAYREVTRAAGGRFHWFGDTGERVVPVPPPLSLQTVDLVPT